MTVDEALAAVKRAVELLPRIEAGLKDYQDGKAGVEGELKMCVAALRAIGSDGPLVVIPLTDYKRMWEALECDDRVKWCETCKAWLDADDPACATTEDYTGCWKIAAGEDDTGNNCRSYRATIEGGKP